jgi:hypothetical protein
MTEIEIGKLIALAPLLVALIVAVRVGLKALKADPMTDDDKDSRNEAFKAGLYIFAAATLIWKFTPSFGTGLTILWTILTSIFAVMVILTVIELSSKYDNLHDRLWTAGRKTPLYSKSDEGVQYIRWARRIMLAVLVVVAIFCGIFGALTTTSSADQAAKAGPAPTTQAEASKTPSSTTAPTTTAPTSAAAPAAPDTFKNECGGLDPKKVSTPANIDFKVADKLFICNDGDWKTWAQVNPNTEAPAQALLTYWTTDTGKKNGYGVVVINNTPYLFWTTAIQA